MHVAHGVAGCVLADGVEGEVGVGEAAARGPLEVAHEARRVGREVGRDGVHVEEVLFGPGHFAPHEAERVAPGDGEWPDADHAALRCGHGEVEIGALVGADEWDRELAQRWPDWELRDSGEGGPTAAVFDANAHLGFPARDDAASVEEDPDRVGAGTREERQRDQDEGRAGGGDEPRFDPGEGRPEYEADEGERDHEPAERGDRVPDRTPGLRGAAAGATPPTPKLAAPAFGAAECGLSGAGLSEARPGAARATGAARAGAEEPAAGGVGAHAVPFSCGIGVSSRICPMTASAVTPSNSASGSSTRRCASTGIARSRTSSGVM